MLLILAFFAVNIEAAVFNVNTTADTQDATPGNGTCADSAGSCSLRAAITEANALAGADIINLPAGTYTQTLTGSENNNAGGDWDINTEITLNGADPLTTFVQANALPGLATERVFHVRFTAGMVVNISGVTIENGRNAGNVFGAGIRLDLAAGTLNLDNVVVRNNRNASSGGGISLSGAAGATLNITDSAITDNVAGSTTAGTSGTGGGIHINNNPAFLNITNSTVSNNTASSGITFGLGGGIGANGTVNIEDSMITGNTAASSANSAFGGGLYIPTGTTTLTDTIVSGNASNSTAGGAFAGFAGGAYNQNATLIIIKSLFRQNTASHFHGGIRTLASTVQAFTRIIDTLIEANSAPIEGGGVANIVGSTFDATTDIENSTLKSNFTTGATSVGGGALNFSAGTGTAKTTCLNSTFSGNSAAGSGGNLHNQQNAGAALLDINFCTIMSGSATVGGGLSNLNGSAIMKNSILAGNNATTGPNINGILDSGDYNLIQIITGGIFVPMPNDDIGSDPLLGPLQNNGGPTPTHLPASQSPAVNKIPNGTNQCGNVVSTDQRGFTRPDVSVFCDKGAVEVGLFLLKPPFDYDGDGRSDLAVTRNIGLGASGATNQIRWFIHTSSNGGTLSSDWGVATDTPLGGDFDGDGRFDIIVWRPISVGMPSGNAFFYILQSETNTLRLEDFGQTGDDPQVVGDYDGDGKADLAVYRQGIGAESGTWFIRRSANNPSGNITYNPWGLSGDIAAAGDYDGDGKKDIAVYRPGTGIWYLRSSANSSVSLVRWGLPTDKPFPGDYDGDGKDDIAIVRSSGGSTQFWVNLSANGETSVTNFGGGGGIIEPLHGDFDGDGKLDIAVARSASSNLGGASQMVFWIRRSATSDVIAIPFGLSGDYPVASRGISFGP